MMPNAMCSAILASQRLQPLFAQMAHGGGILLFFFAPFILAGILLFAAYAIVVCFRNRWAAGSCVSLAAAFLLIGCRMWWNDRAGAVAADPAILRVGINVAAGSCVSLAAAFLLIGCRMWWNDRGPRP